MITDPENDRSGGRAPWALSGRHLVLLAIVALAALLRLGQLDEFPPLLAHDEAYEGLDALWLVEGGRFPVFHEGWELYAEEAHLDRPVPEDRWPVFLEGNYGREPLHAYLTALVIRLFGAVPLAPRLVAALAGIAAVPATYLAAAALLVEGRPPRPPGELEDRFRRYAPLLAAAVMAILYPALSFSRIGVRTMLLVPLEVLTVYCFWRGLSTGHQRVKSAPAGFSFRRWRAGEGGFVPFWFGASGLLLGLSLYTYGAARFMPLVFAIWVIAWLVRSRAEARIHLANFAIMAAVAALVSLPLVLYLVRFPYYLLYRSRVVANRGAGTFPGQPWLTWAQNVGRVLRGLVWQGDTQWLHNLPGRAYLDPIQVGLALAGLASLAGRRISKRSFFLLVWLGVMLLPGILTGDAPHFGRLIGAAAPLAILIARGATWLAQGLVARLGRADAGRAMGMAAALLLLLFAVSAALAWRDYFRRYALQPELSAAFLASDWRLGQEIAREPASTMTYLSPGQEQMATIYYAIGGAHEDIRSFTAPLALLPVGRPGRPILYAIRPGAEPVIDRLEEYYPGATLSKPDASFSLFRVSAAENPSLVAAEPMARWGGAINLQAWSAEQENGALVVSLLWLAEVAIARDYTAYVHVLSPDGPLVAQEDRPPEGYPTSDWLPGEQIFDRFTVQLPAGLAAGPYVLQTGFYHLPTDERLGTPQVLGQVDVRPQAES